MPQRGTWPATQSAPHTAPLSTRTKAALAAAKARGVKLGNPRLLAGSPDQARMAAAAKSAKAPARRERPDGR